MAYKMAATIVTLNDLGRYLSVAGLFKCNPSNIYAAFYTISIDSVLARFLCISRASCFTDWCTSYFAVCCYKLLPSSSRLMFSPVTVRLFVRGQEYAKSSPAICMNHYKMWILLS